MVKPEARFSWQYHHRREEVLRVMQGSLGAERSFDDTEGSILNYLTGDTIKLENENDID